MIRGMTSEAKPDPERQRLRNADAGTENWRLWGPYLSERQWGTVREDYSANGKAWDSFPHDHARSRAYRWGEDGLLGISDDHGFLNFGIALWNGVDPYLKERLFGLSGPQGNHGEDVKEHYVYLDNVPTHSYMKARYRYPQRAFPYEQLVAENGRRGRDVPEYEIDDTGVFADGRYWDVVVEYAKAAPEDIVIRLTATNRGPDAATLHLLPTVTFRNTWSWGYDATRPIIQRANKHDALLVLRHERLGDYWLACDGGPELLFTENDTNFARLWGGANRSTHVKDGINDAVVHGAESVSTNSTGTKAAAHYTLAVAAGESGSVLLRLSKPRRQRPFEGAERLFTQRLAEADRFYAGLCGASAGEAANVQRQAFAGLLWSKQWYMYDVPVWLRGDPAGPVPPQERWSGRNATWIHLNNADVLLMPDSWEYPWYAAWDLAFHCVTMALIDPEFAKSQLLLLMREWYMHPNGALPAYEWALGNVNPPVHAWAALKIYRDDAKQTGKPDRAFLERMFHKLLLNFTWWVNRQDSQGDNVFAGGFLGLDNIGIFDRSKPPGGRRIEQADGTAWMGMFCLNMLAIALELAEEDTAYEDLATKFFEHFLYIAGALNGIGRTNIALWDETDQFFYDVVQQPGVGAHPLRVRSFVGLIPLFAVEAIDGATLDRLPNFCRRMTWFLQHRPELATLVSRWEVPGAGAHRLMALVRGHRMKALLRRALDPAEFLSDHGVRSLSRYHLDHPLVEQVDGVSYVVNYEPAESTTPMFGGNSNWRGPIWFPLNYLLIEALRRFGEYYGDGFTVECPAGSGEMHTLAEASNHLGERLISLFMPDESGRRPVNGDGPSDGALFYEYFHGDTGRGLGASHQTGWTALVANLIADGREPAGGGADEQ
jgi:hypothetical protein